MKMHFQALFTHSDTTKKQVCIQTVFTVQLWTFCCSKTCFSKLYSISHSRLPQRLSAL